MLIMEDRAKGGREAVQVADMSNSHGVQDTIGVPRLYFNELLPFFFELALE